MNAMQVLYEMQELGLLEHVGSIQMDGRVAYVSDKRGERIAYKEFEGTARIGGSRHKWRIERSVVKDCKFPAERHVSTFYLVDWLP